MWKSMRELIRECYTILYILVYHYNKVKLYLFFNKYNACKLHHLPHNSISVCALYNIMWPTVKVLALMLFALVKVERVIATSCSLTTSAPERSLLEGTLKMSYYYNNTESTISVFLRQTSANIGDTDIWMGFGVSEVGHMYVSKKKNPKYNAY